MITKAVDMIGREIAVGDYVVFYGNLYIVETVTVRPNHATVRIMLLDKTATTRAVIKPARQTILVSAFDVTAWLLKGKP